MAALAGVKPSPGRSNRSALIDPGALWGLPQGRCTRRSARRAARNSALDEIWQRHQDANVRWRLFPLQRKLLRHAGAWVLKIARESLDLLHSICARSFACAAANRGP